MKRISGSPCEGYVYPLFEMEKIPDEVQQRIYLTLMTSQNRGVPFGGFVVSKNISRNFTMAQNEWINITHICLGTLWGKGTDQTIQRIIDRQLRSANLSYYRYLNDDDLGKLIQNRPDLEHLSIGSNLLGMRSVPTPTSFPKLASLSMGQKDTFPSVVMIKWLGNLSQLEELHIHLWSDPELRKLSDNLMRMDNFSSPDIRIFEQDRESKFAGALGKLINLRKLNVRGDNVFSIKASREALCKLTKLEELDVSTCKEIPYTEFIDALKQLPNLKKLDIRDCPPFDKYDFSTEFSHLDVIKK